MIPTRYDHIVVRYAFRIVDRIALRITGRTHYDRCVSRAQAKSLR